MAHNEIIKHLENNINGLDYFEVSDEEVLDLINRQKAEIERLQFRLRCHRSYIEHLEDIKLLTELTGQ